MAPPLLDSVAGVSRSSSLSTRGCKGGPGYRDPDGRCVGYADLIRKCGPPPHRLCRAECAPLHEGCSHGRVWLKDLLARSGLSVQFIGADLAEPGAQPEQR